MENSSVPYIVYESQGARLERNNKRFFLMSVILAVILVASNLAWVCYVAQFDNVVTTTTIEATINLTAENTRNIFIGGDYAEADNKNYQNNKNAQEEVGK